MLASGTFVAKKFWFIHALHEAITPLNDTSAHAMGDNFVDLKDISSAGGMKIQYAPAGSVIKSTSIKEGAEKRRVIHHASKSSVEPIIENDLVVGVRVKCACGDVTEVFFQYKHNTDSL